MKTQQRHHLKRLPSEVDVFLPRTMNEGFPAVAREEDGFERVYVLLKVR